jgi:hypothetical protein
MIALKPALTTNDLTPCKEPPSFSSAVEHQTEPSGSLTIKGCSVHQLHASTSTLPAEAETCSDADSGFGPERTHHTVANPDSQRNVCLTAENPGFNDDYGFREQTIRTTAVAIQGFPLKPLQPQISNASGEVGKAEKLPTSYLGSQDFPKAEPSTEVSPHEHQALSVWPSTSAKIAEDPAVSAPQQAEPKGLLVASPAVQSPEIENEVASQAVVGTDSTQSECGCLDLEDIRQQLINHPCNGLLPDDLAQSLAVMTWGLPYTQSMMTIDTLTLFSSLTKLGTRVNGNKITRFEVPTNLYVATVGASGCMKSPKIQATIYEPITGIESQIMVRNEKRHEEWLTKCEDLPKGAKKPKEPTRLQHNFQQYTSAGVDALLAAHESEQLATLGLIDEGTLLFKQVKATTGQEERLLELYDGKGNKTLLATGNRCYSRSHMSLHISIQDAVLRKLFSANPDDNGLWARFLYYPMQVTPTRLPTDQTEDQLRQSQEARATLKRYAERVFGEEPRTYFLDKDGIALLSEYDHKCQLQQIKGDHPSLKAIKGKSGGKVLRIAGLLHIAWSVHAGGFQQTIPVKRLADAIELVDLLDSYAAALHLSAIPQPCRGFDDTLLRRIHNLSLKAGAMSWSEIREKLNSKEKHGVTAPMAQQYFQQLQQMGVGVVSKGPRGGSIYQAQRPYLD